MIVQDLIPDADGFRYLKVDRPKPTWEGWRSLEQTTSLLPTWERPTIRFARAGEEGYHKRDQVSDFPWLNGALACVLSRRAASELGAMLLRHGELLPVDCPDGEFLVYHCMSVLDAVDEARCEGQRGERTGTLVVRKYAFKPDVVHGHDLFRISGRDRYRIFASGTFVKAVTLCGLRGLTFKYQWSDDANSEGGTVPSAPSERPRFATNAKPLPTKSIDMIAQAVSEGEKLLSVDLAYTPGIEVQQKIFDLLARNGPKMDQSIHEASVLASLLGSVWGQVVCRDFGWQWAWVRERSDEATGIVSPTRSHVAFPHPHIYSQMARSGQSPTSLELYNMIATGTLPTAKPGYLLILA